MSLSLLINATPCVIGGGVQVAVGFIRHALTEASRRGWRVTVVASAPVAAQCAAEAAACGVALHACAASPASPWGGRSTRRLLRELVRSAGAEMVFTVFGPSYVKFEVPELMGFADGFTICPEPGCYANHPWSVALVSRLKKSLKVRKMRGALEFWVETETARQGLMRVVGCAPEAVRVVANGVNALIAGAATGRAPAETGDILLMGAPYWHKNHALLIPTAVRLRALLPDRPWRMVVTLPPSAPVWCDLQERARRAGLADRFVNLGVLDVAACAAAIEAGTVVVHPSLLETFSATYVEAMALGRPLAVSDRAFAREICGEAAAYFDPHDAENTARVLARLLTDAGERARLVALGRERVKRFPDAAAKNGALCDLIDDFARRHA